LQTGKSQAGKSQPGKSQPGKSQPGTSQPGTSQTGKTGAPQTATPQTATSQTAAPQTATSQTATPLAVTSLTGTSQTGTSQNGASQTGTSPVDTSQLAIIPPDTTRSGAPPTPRTVKHRSVTLADAAAKGILVLTTQHSTWGRVSFVLRGNPAPEVRSIPDGLEVHLAAGIHLEVLPSAHLREIGPIDVHDDGGAAVAVIHLTCHCMPDQDNRSGALRFDIRPDPKPAPQPGTQPVIAAKAPVVAQPETAAKAATELKTPAGVRPEPPVNLGPEAKTADSAKPDPAAKTATNDRAGPEAKTEASAKPVAGAKPGAQDAAARTGSEAKPETAAKTATSAKSIEADELARLRAFLTEKLAKLNANPPQVTPPTSHALRSDAAASRPTVSPTPQQTPSGGPATGGAVAQAQPGPSAGSPTTCLARIDASGWRRSGSYTERLVALRFQAARSHSAAEDVATLAEFYLANGLGHEALAAATEALAMDASPAARLRLTRDADIGSLTKGEKLSADSPLLANPVDCKRADAALWRDLAAAADGDAEGAARDPEVAAAALRTLPEPLQRELAFRIVAAVGDNLDALRAMAGGM